MNTVSNLQASRRGFITLGLGGLSLAALAACAPESTPAPVASPTFGADLRMSLFGTPERQARVQSVLDLYTKKFGGAATAEAVANTSYAEKLATEVAGGAAADLFAMFHLAVADYARRDVLVSLDDWSNVLDVSEFDQKAIASGVIDGKRYALPMGDNAYGIIYDKGAIEGSGMKVPEPGYSWDDFVKFANDLTKKRGSGYFGTLDASGDYNFFQVWVRQQGAQLYDDEGNLGYSKKIAEEWFEIWADLRKSGAAPPADVTAESATGGNGTSLIVTGRASNFSIFTNVLGGFQTLTQSELTLSTPPMDKADNSGLYVRASNWMAVYSRGSNVDDGVNLMNFMLNDPEAVAVLGSEFGAPANIALRAEQTFEGPAKTFVDYVDLVSNDFAQDLPSLAIEFPEGSPDVSAAFLTTSQSIASGQESVSDGVAAFLTTAEGLLL